MVSLPAVKMAVAPPSHTFLPQTGRLSPWRRSFLALRGDNKVEMCLKREGGRGMMGMVARRGRERDKLQTLPPKYFKPQGSLSLGQKEEYMREVRAHAQLPHDAHGGLCICKLSLFFTCILMQSCLYSEGQIPLIAALSVFSSRSLFRQY